MRNNFDHLRVEHADILALIEQIRHLLEPEIVKKKSKFLYDMIANLSRKTLAHLLLEDRCICQEMLLSSHDETRMLAQQHVASMGSMAQHMRDFLESWPSFERISAQPKDFCKESNVILSSLEARINREEQVLYPKAEAVL